MKKIDSHGIQTCLEESDRSVPFVLFAVIQNRQFTTPFGLRGAYGYGLNLNFTTAHCVFAIGYRRTLGVEAVGGGVVKG